jgi:predicted PurR-regulated permease PerM
MASERSKKIEGRFLVGTLVVFALLSFFVIREFLWYVAGGLLLVFAFFPVHRRVRKVFKRRAVASFISFMIVIAVVMGPLVLVGFMIFNDAVNFAQNYNPERLNETVQSFLDQFGFAPAPEAENLTGNETAPSTSAVANGIGNAMKAFSQRLVGALIEVAPTLAVGLVVASFVIYYGFAEGELFYSKFRHALPLPDEIEESLFREIRKVTQVVFVGNILVSVVGGVIGAVSFVVFGVPNAVFWGFIMIILGILPVVGAPLVWAPAALWLAIQGNLFGAGGILIVNGVIVIGYIDNILRPKLIGKVANVHPVVILIGVLGGVEAFGPLGFVIGPLVLAIFIALIRAYTSWHPRWRERRREGSEHYSPEAEIEVVGADDSERRPPRETDLDPHQA